MFKRWELGFCCSTEPSARYNADTVNVGLGQRYDVIWTARQPGKWLIHCHIGHHTTNNNVEMRGGGGLMGCVATLRQLGTGRVKRPQ
jgi:hypothetical protein